MAKKSNTTRVLGPSMSGGYGANTLPPNPSDMMMEGKAIPIRPPQDQVTRRSFSIPTKPPMHYNDGCGPDEVVTSRRTNTPIDTLLGHQDHCDKLEHSFGQNPNHYSDGPDDATTTNGVDIYGT